jgi:hypothetical protein
MALPLPPEPTAWQPQRASAVADRLSPAAHWYFAEEWLAIDPALPITESDGRSLSAPLWLAAPTLLTHRQLEPTQRHLRQHNGAESAPFTLVPALSSNPVFINQSTLNYLAQQPLRVRGEWQGEQFQVRTLWPEQWRINEQAPLLIDDWSHLVVRGIAAAQQPFTCHRLWQCSRPAKAGDSAQETPRWVIGFMLNGAQGDDDEAHGGHFALTLGRWQPDGCIADWLVANFYNPDVVSEKGILPALVPMDNYLADVNSGQQQYRPSWLVCLAFSDERLASALYAQLLDTIERLYDHRLHYQHTDNNCTGLSMDALRTVGIRVPMRGASSRLLAPALYLSTLLRERSLHEAYKASRYLLAEQTRVIPWQAFTAGVNHVLALVQGRVPAQTEMETLLQTTTLAVYGLHFPQLPSARAWGREPAIDLFDYQRRVPAKHADWKIIPVPARELPAALHRRDINNTAPADAAPINLAPTKE